MSGIKLLERGGLGPQGAVEPLKKNKVTGAKLACYACLNIGHIKGMCRYTVMYLTESYFRVRCKDFVQSAQTDVGNVRLFGLLADHMPLVNPC